MAANLNTNVLFPNISVDSGAGTMTLTLSDFTQQLLAAEVDPAVSTSDWRELVFSFLDQLFVHYDGLAVVDRPAKIAVSKSGRLEATGEMRYTYSVTIHTTVAQQDVSPEATP